VRWWRGGGPLPHVLLVILSRDDDKGEERGGEGVQLDRAGPKKEIGKEGGGCRW
jgi:hypothetical protein